ncbi:MAG: Tol-Pal system beta propeller repeat protein TolB [Nitrospinales bacterium]
MRRIRQPFFFIVLSIFGFAFLPGLLSAQPSIEIDLSRETRREVRIAVPAFVQVGANPKPNPLGEEARKILENDLRLSELFVPEKPETYGPLAEAEGGDPAIDYQAWNNLGVQWVIKTKFSVEENKTLSLVFRLYDAVNSRFLVGKRYRAHPALLRRIIHRFADEVVAQLTGKPGVAETRIAFVKEEEHKEGKTTKVYKELYTVDFDGHNLKQLTNDQSIALTPTWSPGGERLVFTSYVDNNPDLIMIDLANKERRAILKLPGLNAAPAWSPDGSKIALVLSRDDNSEIYILDKDAQLTRLTRHFNIDTSPAWSPDGKKIAFTSDRSGTGAPQIYIMDAKDGDNGTVERISFGSSYNDNPVWSPDGERIAYTSRVGRRFQIKIYNVKTRNTLNFTSGLGSGEEPSWSPDSRFIVYRHTEKGKKHLYIKRIGSDKARKLSSLSDGALHPAWSPRLSN